ncbi:ATP-binding protein [Bifidobacterium sp. CP2]|uniref:ATP-binding protein n=1 Tax=Bifidobacterium sp. CP2 TaxID=2809025 RepID=UPI001BDCEAEE|nr:ATP-binding protein [Bifidobacterium sp. CP2]MBT1180773.1 ATP-binding protein [Bifidobacterium sp. CP2]
MTDGTAPNGHTGPTGPGPTGVRIEDPLFPAAMAALGRAARDATAMWDAAGESDARHGLETLDALRYGGFAPSGTRPVPIGGVLWTAVDEIERATPGRPNMIERLLRAWNGADGELDIVIRRRDDGLRLMLGGYAAEDRIGKARMTLAPTAALRRVGRDEALPRRPRHARSLMFRMQEPGGAVREAAEGMPGVRGDAAPGFPLLERLQTSSGDWTLALCCTPAWDGMRSRLSWELGAIGDAAACRMTRTVQTGGTVTATVTSDPWRRVHDWTLAYQRWMNEAGACGMWSVRAVVMADDGDAVMHVVSALEGAVTATDGTAYETFSAPVVPDAAEPDATGPAATAASPPPAFASLLTSREIGALLAPPAYGMPGLAVRMPQPASRRRPAGRDVVDLGVFRGTSLRAGLPVHDLAGHGLICGSAGSGKSTTIRRLLAEAWNQHGIPFLLVDPLKDDYTPIADRFDGGLHVVHGRQLRMNLMEPWPGTRMTDHLMRVAEALRGAFALPSPTPLVLTRLFRAVAERYGDGTGGTPSLFDVRAMADGFVHGLGYCPEVESNIRAALCLRLDTLLDRDMAPFFCWRDSSMVVGLFDRPTVVCLDDVPDEETRSFLMLLLAQAVWWHARRSGPSDDVRHLFVLEEAHRVMPPVDDALDDDPEKGSSRRSASRMLSTMMAEIRGFGESMIVVDQSPSRIARDAARNTGFKIAHRLTETADRTLMADMIGLPEPSSQALSELAPGTCMMSSRFEPSPQVVSVVAAPAPGGRPRDDGEARP